MIIVMASPQKQLPKRGKRDRGAINRRGTNPRPRPCDPIPTTLRPYPRPHDPEIRYSFNTRIKSNVTLINQIIW